MCPTTVFAKKMASDTKAVVAAMMKLPKAQRLEQLLAMSAECVARREDAAPLLSLIQLELDSPDDADDEAPARTTSSAAPAMPKKKSVRRQLKERRDELRAMVAKVDAALGSSGGSSAASTHGKGPDAVTFAHLSRGQQLQLARSASRQVPRCLNTSRRGFAQSTTPTPRRSANCGISRHRSSGSSSWSRVAWRCRRRPSRRRPSHRRPVARLAFNHQEALRVVLGVSASRR